MNVVRFPTAYRPRLSKRQLAAHLGCSTRTIERLVREGMPSIPPGQSGTNRRAFVFSEVEEWLGRRGSR